MELRWEIMLDFTQGPPTSQELADEVEKEGKLLTDRLWCPEGRCLWGVIDDWGDGEAKRRLVEDDVRKLAKKGLGYNDNDTFEGTPEERCQEMVRRLRAIP